MMNTVKSLSARPNPRSENFGDRPPRAKSGSPSGTVEKEFRVTPEIARENMVDEQIARRNLPNNDVVATDRFQNFRESGETLDGQRGATRAAAVALFRKKSTVICLGSNASSRTGNALPSTEEISGALVLGISARDSGSAVTYVADEPTAKMIEALLKDLPKAAAGDTDIKIHVFQSKCESDGGRSNDEAKKEAASILKNAKADSVVAIELQDAPEKTKVDGVAPRRAFSPIYEVVRAANAKDLLIVAAGNGEGERIVGFGRTPSTVSIAGSEKNLTGVAVGALLMKYRGKLDRFIQPNDFEKVAKKMFFAKAKAASQAECATEKAFPEEPTSANGSETYLQSNREMFEFATDLVRRQETIPGYLNTPTPLAIFDSSNGAFIAAKVLDREFHKRGLLVDFIIVVDHKNAPYGQFAGDKKNTLFYLVSAGLKTCQREGAALVGMACNTACIVPEAQKEITIPVVDLIQVTARAIAKDGGENPVLISTVATSRSDAYPDAVRKASGARKLDLRKTKIQSDGAEGDDEYVNLISAPNLASLINRLGDAVMDTPLRHNEGSSNAEATKMITDLIAKVPEDATSVWLTCTHYPVFEAQFRAALRDRGMDIDVINPIRYQAQAIAAQIAQLKIKPVPKSGDDGVTPKYRVVTSAAEEHVDFITTSATALFRPMPVEPEAWRTTFDNDAN